VAAAAASSATAATTTESVRCCGLACGDRNPRGGQRPPSITGSGVRSALCKGGLRVRC
jgi:hypothetical protein